MAGVYQREDGVVDEEVGDDVGDGVVGALLALLSHSTAIWCPATTRAPFGSTTLRDVSNWSFVKLDHNT